MDEFQKRQKRESWKRLGRLILIVLGFIVAVLVFVSYSYEEEAMKEGYDMGDDEKELLEDLQTQ
ncbi:MAG TPA: hypothetical protein VL947_10160 [Cytophagales bacterium]|nr:hypothetical protein [Cytophagales bacterium]